MADTLHSALTGSDLHESKGADAASLGQVAVATGSGTAVFASLNYSYLAGKPTLPVITQAGSTIPAPIFASYSVAAVAGEWSLTLSGITTLYNVQVRVVDSATGTGSLTATLNAASATSLSGQIVKIADSSLAPTSTATVYVFIVGA